MQKILFIYLWILIFRPQESWNWLGQFHIERVIAIITIIMAFSKRNSGVRLNFQQFLLLLFASSLLISSLLAYNSTTTFDVTTDYLKIVIFFFIICHCVTSYDEIKKLLGAYLLVMSLCIGKSCWEFFVNNHHVYRMGIRRLIAIDQTYGDPNAFAASICYSLPIAWALWSTNLFGKQTRNFL